jgi:hypothetical protein
MYAAQRMSLSNEYERRLHSNRRRIMKRTLLGCMILAMVTGTVFPETIALRGRVTDPSGNPLTHTLVRLGQTRFDNGYGMSPYYTLTDSNGEYRLGAGGSIGVLGDGRGGLANNFSQPTFAGGKVLFNLPQGNTLVQMGMYTLAGRLVREVMNTRLAKGTYAVSIDMKGTASQFCLLRVSIDGNAWVMKLNPASRGQAAQGGLRSAGIDTRLEKLAAVVDTLYATEPGYTPGVQPIQTLAGQFDFTLTKNNTWDGDTAAFWDTTKIKKEPGKLWYTILNRTGGQFPDSMIYWAIGDFGAPVRLSDSAHIDFTKNASGRLYIMVGYKPTYPGNMRPRTQAWDFEEHTNGPDNNGSIWFHGNTTRVDAYGLPMAYRLHCTNFDTVRGEQYHVFFQTRQSFFAEYLNEVPKEFTDLGLIQAPYRIPNPANGQIGRNGQYADYWNKYTAAFGINAQAYLDGIPEPKISAGCHRHVMGLSVAEQADDHNYYKEAPCNFYSYFLHRRAIDGRCYGFPYDDYANWSSYIEHGAAQWVAIAVGY